VVQGAAIAGAGKIIAVDVLANKLEFAKKIRRHHTINANETKPVEAIRALTAVRQGRGLRLLR